MTVLFVTAAFLSCGEDSPEKQVRRLIGEAETSAEEKNIAGLKKLVSPTYSDRYGNDRQAVTGIVTYYFLRNETIHLLVRVRDLVFPVPERAEASLFVAMAGTPIPTPESIDPLKADFYRFDIVLSLEEGGKWLLVEADWKPARARDIF